MLGGGVCWRADSLIRWLSIIDSGSWKAEIGAGLKSRPRSGSGEGTMELPYVGVGTSETRAGELCEDTMLAAAEVATEE